MATKVPAEREFLPGIEALRGIAAASVVVHHMWSLGNRPAFPGDFVVEGFGGWGVNLFFLLSGFLLADFFWKGKGLGLRTFYTRRLVRLVPAYYVCVAVLFIFFADHDLLFSRIGLRQVFANGTFTQYMRPETASSLNVNGALWTLTNEFLLYLLMPVLALATLKFRYWAVAAFMLIGTAYRMWSAIGGDPLMQRYFGSTVASANAELYLARQFLGVLPLFALGVGVRWWQQRSRSNAAGWVRRRGRFQVPVMLLLLVPSVLWLKGVERGNDYRHWVWFTFYDLFTAVLLVAPLLYCARPHGGGRPFDLRGLLWLGERSYGLYLWHFPIILSVYGMGPFLQPADTAHIWSKVVLIVGLSLTFAHVSFVAIERPAMRWGRAHAKPRSGPWLDEPAQITVARPGIAPVADRSTVAVKAPSGA